MKLGFIYAGQGTQYVGMGQSFYENDEDCKNLLDNVKLDFDLKDIMFNSDEKTISTTRFTQPAMVAVANMATLLLKKNGITPDYVCGLSLGEYSALSAAGVFDPETAIQVVRERGLAMEKAAEGFESAMMAILGLEREPLLDICVGCDGYVSIANYNCPGQLVIAGEKKAVEEATFAAGAREVHLIEEPVAAAIGAGIDISKPCGNMIVDIGGGTADIAVISLGGTVVNTSIKVAGDDFDEAIVRYMRKKHNLLIGERTAEDIKIKIGTTYPLAEEEKMEVRGRNLVTGLPKTVTVTSSETEEALRECTGQIVEAVVSVLEQTPPELSADILDRGIVLTGGGSLLRGLEELIEEKTGINTMTAEDPMKVVAIGTGEFVEFMSGRKDY